MLSRITDHAGRHKCNLKCSKYDNAYGTCIRLNRKSRDASWFVIYDEKLESIDTLKKYNELDIKSDEFESFAVELDCDDDFMTQDYEATYKDCHYLKYVPLKS